MDHIVRGIMYLVVSMTVYYYVCPPVCPTSHS